MAKSNEYTAVSVDNELKALMDQDRTERKAELNLGRDPSYNDIIRMYRTAWEKSKGSNE